MSATAERIASPGRRGEVVYQIYVRSFRAGNARSHGDLDGITAALPYLADLGVDVLWITPFFVSPMADFGYDVADYRAVDPMFGDLAALDRLVDGAHARGLKVIFDLVASHTSDRHAWFVESRRDRTNPKADWYVWADPRPDGSPPNNWLAIFGGTAWQWEPRRRQYYLHNFLTSQPDLNFLNRAVQDEILDTVAWWLGRGVDGFRLDVVNFYAHDARLRNNPPAPADRRLKVTTRANPYGWQDHVYDIDRPETLAFLERLRAVTDAKDGAMLMGEVVTDHRPAEMMRRMTAGRTRLHMAYSFDLFGAAMSVDEVRTTVRDLDRAVGPRGWIAWALSNHDVPRVLTRWGHARDPDRAAPLLLAFLASLRGTPCLYQGDELGLPEAEIPFEALQDPYGKAFWPEYKGRDGCRTPFPWDADDGNAGFAPAGAPPPWLPMPDAHRRRAAATQARDPASALSRVRRFLAWRRTQTPLVTGAMEVLDTPDPVIALVRRAGRERVLAAFNLSDAAARCSLDLGPARPLDGHGFAGTCVDGVLDLPPYGAVFAALHP